MNHYCKSLSLTFPLRYTSLLLACTNSWFSWRIHVIGYPLICYAVPMGCPVFIGTVFMGYHPPIVPAFIGPIFHYIFDYTDPLTSLHFVLLPRHSDSYVLLYPSLIRTTQSSGSGFVRPDAFLRRICRSWDWVVWWRCYRHLDQPRVVSLRTQISRKTWRPQNEWDSRLGTQFPIPMPSVNIKRFGSKNLV